MVDPSIGAPPEPTLLVVGAATRDVDAVVSRVWRLGGTVAYASLAAAHLGVRVKALIGVDAATEAATELDILRAAGIEVQAVRLGHGPVFENRQTSGGRIQIGHQASDRLPAAALPSEWRSAPVVLMGPVAGELGEEWADVPSPESFVALTWQGLLRRLVPGRPVGPLPLSRTPLVERANALFVSSEDVSDADQPLERHLDRSQQLLLTHREHGAIQLWLEGTRRRGWHAPALAPVDVVDTTGAGDVFAGAWLATRLLAPAAPADRHLLAASAMAGLSVGGSGLADMPGRGELCEALIRRRDRGRG